MYLSLFNDYNIPHLLPDICLCLVTINPHLLPCICLCLRWPIFHTCCWYLSLCVYSTPFVWYLYMVISPSHSKIMLVLVKLQFCTVIFTPSIKVSGNVHVFLGSMLPQYNMALSVCMYVCYVTLRQKKIRTLLSKVGGWDLVCWLFSHI